MKAAGKLKNIDFKGFFVDHGEKVALGVVALIGLLSLLGTRWAGFSEIEPEQLKQKVDQTRSSVVSSEWPEQERDTYAVITNFEREATGLFDAIDIASYRYSTDFTWPLFQAVEKSREPRWLAPQNLIGDSGRVVLAMQLDSSSSADDLDSGFGDFPEEGEDTDVDNEFAPRRGAGSGATGGLGEPGGDLGFPGAGVDDTSSEGYGDVAEGIEGDDDGFDDSEFEMGDNYGNAAGYDGSGSGGSGEMGEGFAATEKSQGYRYVALRAVFPIKDQAAEIRQALSLSNTLDATDLVNIIEFELERKRAVSGPSPWSGDWEKVDLTTVEDILSQTVAWESEVVEIGVTDSAITMPLPARMMGMWGDHATHPAVENFTLSVEEQELQEKLIQKILEKADDGNSNRPDPVKKGGFSKLSVDFSSARDQVMGSSDASSFLSGLSGDLMGDNNKKTSQEEKNQTIQKLKEATASGRLILFRFFDFDVEPGNAYEYRVRMVIKNPNYARPLPELVDPYSAKGQTRETPWASLGAPVVVEQDAEYFLTRVNPRTSAASLSVFEWLAETGTLVRGAVDVALGQFVGGKTRTEVLRPAEGRFEDEEIVLNSHDVLIDTLGTPDLQSDMHPDLTLSGRSRAQTPIVATSLVMDSNGRLIRIDPISTVGKARKIQDTLDRMAKAYEHLKDVGGAEGDGAEGLLEGFSGEGSGEMGMDGGSGSGMEMDRGRRTNSRRKSSSAGSSRAGMGGRPSMMGGRSSNSRGSNMGGGVPSSGGRGVR